MLANSCFVFRVMIHRSRPMIKLKRAVTTIIQPENLSHPRAGVASAGRVRTKVMRVMTALAMPAVSVLASTSS